MSRIRHQDIHVDKNILCVESEVIGGMTVYVEPAPFSKK